MTKIYPWQNTQWQRFQKMQQQNRLPHAILLSGPRGIGLKEFAQSAAMQLLCLSHQTISNIACGICKSCRLYIAGNHPDLNYIEPEDSGKQIKIAQIRELIEYVTLKSFTGKRKIVIIEPADAMNRSTANALLKTLEEPPSQSMLFLLSNMPSKLPITIRSRCQRIDFKPAHTEADIDWLKNKLVDTKYSAEALLRLSGGGPLRALSLIEDEQLQFRIILLEDLKSMSIKSCDTVQIAANWQKLEIENILNWLMQITLDLIRLKLFCEKSHLMNLDLKEDLQDIANSLDLVSLIRNYDFVLLKYQQSLAHMNYNTLHIIEEILFYWNNPEIGN
ncbi:DNA polymerase III subunit delta' [Gammaproteobacteria bacterium]|nr:DNA polymerase III subunit delta' [Gammaproteobacteria bacterium]